MVLPHPHSPICSEYVLTMLWLHVPYMCGSCFRLCWLAYQNVWNSGYCLKVVRVVISKSSAEEPLYSGHHCSNEILSFIEGVALPQGLICTKRVYLGLSEVAFIKGVLTPGVAFVGGSTVAAWVGHLPLELRGLLVCILWPGHFLDGLHFEVFTLFSLGLHCFMCLCLYRDCMYTQGHIFFGEGFMGVATTLNQLIINRPLLF